MHTIEKMDETLATLEQLARSAILASRNALSLPQNASLSEEIRATSNTAIELLAYAEVGQWASVEADKCKAFDRAVDLARKLGDCTGWMKIPIDDLGFLHAPHGKQ